VVPTPTAKYAVSSQSLSKAVKSGLVVRYTVNEQVAGHFEVLLAASTAKRLGIKGSTAEGLAKGSPKMILIARAILVTTKGGTNTLKIHFSKRTAERLRRLSKVTLTLRLIAHNASTKNPQTITVLSTVVLHR
jgi:hypothetical protein